MAAGDKLYQTSDRSGQDIITQSMVFTIPGDLADATTYTFSFVAPDAIKVTDVQLHLAVTGTVGTDVEADVQDDATSILTALPALAVAAADGSIARVGGGAATGVTHTVIDATKEVIAAGSVVLISILADGTFTVQPNDLTVTLFFVEQQDFDPAP
jgi:hypothetical protein